MKAQTLFGKFDESGSSMTEFVMFLPVFVVAFAGVVNLGKFGYETTRTQILAQRQLWGNVMPITHGVADGGEHMSSVAAGGVASEHLLGLAGDSDNPQPLADIYESGVMLAGLAAGGHWGESYLRVVPFSATSLADEVDPKFDASEVIGDQPFPTTLLNDGINRPMPDGVVSIITSLLSGSGALPAMAAGIRYGEVFGEQNRSFSVGAIGSYTAEAHYDLLVAPSPLKGAATELTFGFAWAMAQTEKEYRVMMNFGDSEWKGANRNATSDRVDKYLHKADAKLEEGRRKAEEARKQRDAEEAANGG